jgi:iron(III) transport system substrate-binding protein
MRQTVSRIAVLLGTLVAVVMLAAACGEDPTPTPIPTATPTPLSEYDATLAAAREEGVVSIIGHESELRRAIVKDEFEKRFPGITVEYLGLPGGEADARCESEWAAGVFNYDVVMARCVNFLFEIADDGGLQRISDNVLLPDLLEEDLWVGGFEESFLDTQNEYIFSFGAFSLSITWQRTDLLPQDEITQIEQLLDPKYAGKIGFADPRESFLSNYQTAFIYENSGESGLRTLFDDNGSPIYGTGDQLIDTMVRTDELWMAVGFPDHRLKSFQDAGLEAANNIEPTQFQNACWMGRTNGFVAIPTDNPHPNATKIWMNWVLGPEAQELWSFESGEPSARTDVPVGTPGRWPDPARCDWKNFQTEEFMVNDRLLNPTRDLVTLILDELGQ